MKSGHEIKMWTPNTVMLIILILIGFFLAGHRLTVGLGETTSLNDIYPWGFWLGFDVLGGVALAAGGFLIAGAVYIFNWKKYKPIVRPALFTAFIGYLLTIIAIILDIGHPLRIWHPVFMWQIHSVMWIVAIHEMLYCTTLAVETSPVFFEGLRWEKARKVIKNILVAAVIFGATLAVMHQMILGALYLIAGSKMSPLWFNHYLPYIFLLSAAAIGLAMVNTETILAGKAFGHKVDPQITRGLAKGTLIALIIYFFVKVFFLLANGSIAQMFDGSLEGNMFILEMAIGVIIPIALFLTPKFRTEENCILSASILVIAGILVNRMNICIFSMQTYATHKGAEYFPTAIEFFVTLGLVCLGIFLYKCAVVYLPVFGQKEGTAVDG